MKNTTLLIVICSLFLIQGCGFQKKIGAYEDLGLSITRDQANTLYENYHDRIAPEIVKTQETKGIDNYGPTEYVWISLQDLMCYAEFLQSVDGANFNDLEISGIRIYFGAYPDDKVTSGDSNGRHAARAVEGYQGRETLFMGATFREDDPNVVYPNEFSRHKLFFIQPVPGGNKYIGTRVPFEFPLENPAGENTGTDLMFNELNSMPPDTPGSNGAKGSKE